MNAIKMSTKELLDIVKENKLKHIKEFNEAVEDYKKLVLKIATSNLEVATTSSLEEFSKFKTFPAPPNSYEDSYIKAIRMLELHRNDSIDVEEDVFNQLVLDEWVWKRGFTMAGSLYKSAFN